MVNEVKIDGRLADNAAAIKKKKDGALAGYRFRIGYTPPEGGTGWINVTYWTGTTLSIDKGTKVTVEGNLGFDTWESNGEKRQAVTVVAEKVDVA